MSQENLFNKYTQINTKKEYLEKRLKLEKSYILFFAYDLDNESEENQENINQEWYEFFEEIKANNDLSKYLEIVMFNQSAEKKLLDLLIESEKIETSNHEDIQYPQLIFAHPHIIDPIYIRNPESFQIYKIIEQNFDYYENKFLNEKSFMFEKISRLLSSYPVIIFIKGTPMDPFCKFSKSFMEMIKKSQIKYKSFDIFKDEALRCWLRIYSGWKTYPQLYINGKIIGGVDKLAELIDSNRFLEIVPLECKKEGSIQLIQKLVESNGVFVFGKGDFEKGDCKNSQITYQILKDLNIKFEIFDVMTDEMVRVLIKNHYNYDYFPMIFSDGKLIGGIKFLKENDGLMIYKYVKLQNNNFYIENKITLDEYLNRSGNTIFKKTEQNNENIEKKIEEYINFSNISKESCQIFSVKDNEILFTFFEEILKIDTNFDFIFVKDNKILNIEKSINIKF